MRVKTVKKLLLCCIMVTIPAEYKKSTLKIKTEVLSS